MQSNTCVGAKSLAPAKIFEVYAALAKIYENNNILAN
jgi:hypothetical protein